MKSTAAIAITFAMSCAPALAETLSARIDVAATEILRPVPDALYGSQIVWWSNSNGLEDNPRDVAAYKAAMTTFWGTVPTAKALGPTVLRYPGGLEAREYRWTDGIGPYDRRPAINWSNRNKGVRVVVGTDEFLRYTEAIGAVGMITLNVNDIPVPGLWHSGSREEALAWLAYVHGEPGDTRAIGRDKNGRDWETVGAWAKRRIENCNWLNANSGLPTRDCNTPYRVPYWELGNEVSYSLVWPLPPVSQTPHRYGEIVARYGSALKTLDPNIKVGVVGNDNPVFGEAAWRGWYEGVAKAARQHPDCRSFDCFDFWVKHTYGPGVGPVAHGPILDRAGTKVEWLEKIPAGGVYTLTLRTHGGGDWRVEVDGAAVASGPSPGGKDAAQTTTPPFQVAAGERRFAIVAGDNVSGRRTLEIGLDAELRGPDGQSRLTGLRGSRAIQALVMSAKPMRATFLPEPKSALGGKDVFITEFNNDFDFRSQRRANEPVYMQDALALAGAYAAFLRSGVVGGANVWTLFDDFNEFGEIEGVAVEALREDAAATGRAFSATGIERGRADHRLRPTGFAHALMRGVLRGDMVNATSNAPTVTTGPGNGIRLGSAGARPVTLPWLDVLAARRPDGTLAVVLINADPDNAFDTTITARGFAPAQVIAKVMAADPMASNDPEDCADGRCVWINDANASLAGDGARYLAPPSSLTAMVLVPR